MMDGSMKLTKEIVTALMNRDEEALHRILTAISDEIMNAHPMQVIVRGTPEDFQKLRELWILRQVAELGHVEMESKSAKPGPKSAEPAPASPDVLCAECGSDQVEIPMWVNPNTEEIGGDYTELQDADVYCNVCEQETRATFGDTTL